MVKLIETANVAQGPTYAVGGQTFVKISAIGDGNCGPHSLALSLIDQIKLGHQFNPALINEFYQAMRDSLLLLRERIKLYRGQPNAIQQVYDPIYPDLANPLEAIVNFIEAHETLENEAFHHFVATMQSRHDIAALQVAMGPALRTLGAFRHSFAVESLGQDASEEERRYAEDIAVDGIESGHESLVPLAHQFGLNVKLYDIHEVAGRTEIRDATVNDNVLPDAPWIHLMHGPGHWSYLMRADQQAGLDCLPLVVSLTSVEDIQVKSESLCSRTEALLASDEKQFQQIKQVAVESHQMAQALRSQLQLSPEKLENLGLCALEKAIILGESSYAQPQSEAEASDEALARSLQNAEIVAFFHRNYQVLTQSQPKKQREVEESIPAPLTPRPRNV